MNKNEKTVRLYEINELSTENSKTYAMSDGTQQTVFSVEDTAVSTANTGMMSRMATEAPSSTSMETKSWQNSVFTDNAEHTVGMTGTTGNLKANRMYLKINIPTLPRNPRIKKAELVLNQKSFVGDDTPAIGLYKITGEMTTGTVSTIPLDYELKKTSSDAKYRFDITNLVDEAYRTGTEYVNLTAKLIKENLTAVTNIVLYGATSTTNKPEICVTYESSYGINTSYRTHSHNLGKFGESTADLTCGNLMFESTDFAWAGSRMPVTIKHMYNSALSDKQYTWDNSVGLKAADYSAMKLGFGWRLNIMQSMVSATVYHNGAMHSGYIYTDEQGNEMRFIHKDNTEYEYEYVSVEDSDVIYDSALCTLKMSDTTLYFEPEGQIRGIDDKYENTMSIIRTNGKITQVTDGAGRHFNFTYDENGYLTAITAPDNTTVSYTYTGNYLSSVTYPDGTKVSITYLENSKPRAVTIEDVNEKILSKTKYQFNDQNRIYSITEYGVGDNGTEIIGTNTKFAYSAAAGRTIVTVTEPADTNEGETSDTVTKTVYSFDDEGEIISEYTYSDTLENTGVTEGDEESELNYIGYTENMLAGYPLINDGTWGDMANSVDDIEREYKDTNNAKYGRRSLKLKGKNSSAAANGVYKEFTALAAGEYTFSAYAKINQAFTGDNAPGVYLRVVDENDTVIAESEHLTEKNSIPDRIVLPFEITEAKDIKVQMLINGVGIAYVSNPQLEKGSFATEYDMLSNPGFENDKTGWYLSDTTVAVSTDDKFRGEKSLAITSFVDELHYAYQTIDSKTKASTRETFTLSGWAKAANALSLRNRDGVENAPVFRLRAIVKYTDGTDEYHYADFSPCTDEWQYASVQFAKEEMKTVGSIRVSCDYSYNVGTAYFDCIQLKGNSVEFDLDESDFTTLSTNTDTDEVDTDDEDTTTEDTAPEFEEFVDAFGNTLTETTFTDGEFGTIYRSNEYDENGNNLIKETDARGNTTTYTVDPDTSRNTMVTDRCGNKTAYEYDAAGKTTKVTSKKADNTEIANVSYTYDAFDNMTEIVRGDGMKYVLGYNTFHELESIGVDGMNTSLIHYDYKNGNGRLKSMTYANGDKMKATYNNLGQMIAETWYKTTDTGTVVTARYKYAYDTEGNIVRSIDISANKEHDYIYDNGKLIRAVEYDIVVSDSETITSRTVVNTVFYVHDSEGNMTKKRVVTTDGHEQVIYYEHPENSEDVVKFTLPDVLGGVTKELNVTSHSKTDSFGRKVFDELQFGTASIGRRFGYYAGKITAEHDAADKTKSLPTTELVEEIVIASTNPDEDDRILRYEYDNEERITKVIDSANVTSEYEYDALGQLVSEYYGDQEINEMTYDNYGNIIRKNLCIYTYDPVWKDRLTSYDGKSITYDAQGNPVSYLGHTLTWEKGRQLKSYDSFTYTYNANGIRTSKNINGELHTYDLEGTKILRESWTDAYGTDHVIVPLYDNEDTVCGITYNGTTYFFVKNLQGDVISLLDSNGKTVVKYMYDAWGNMFEMYDENDDLIDSDIPHIANINPFRYRGYYYDNEIGLYYVSSRYYDPEIGRFLNSDEAIMLFLGQEEILGNNLFSYCENCPTTNVDLWGYVKINIKWLGTAIDLIIWLIPALFAISKIWRTVSKSASKLVSFGNKLISVGKQLFKRFDDRLYCAFAKESTYRIVRTIGVLAGIITIISSIGSIVQYIIDILDGKWDGYLNTNRFGPKLDLTRDY